MEPGCSFVRDYDVREKTVCDWRTNEDLLQSVSKNKCANTWSTVQWLNFEKHVPDMVTENHHGRYNVTRNVIYISLLKWAT
jgi:hypothetical protein